jgi:flagellar basal-body rod protein FlgF
MANTATTFWQSQLLDMRNTPSLHTHPRFLRRLEMAGRLQWIHQEILMDSLVATAGSGMRSRIETLDLLANNIANAGTAGYKADEESYNTYFGQSAWEGYDEGRPDSAEMPVIQRNWTDFSQGTLVPTGNNSDLALTSKGFFVVNTPNGRLYTRNGHLRVSRNGELQTQEGYVLSGINGKPIVLDPTRNFEVTGSGEVRQDGVTVGTLAIMNGNNPSSAGKMGSGYFSFSPGNTVQAVVSPEVSQGHVEMSNVTPATAAVKLVNVMRSFEMLQKAVMMASEMNKKVAEEVAHITG